MENKLKNKQYTTSAKDQTHKKEWAKPQMQIIKIRNTFNDMGYGDDALGYTEGGIS